MTPPGSTAVEVNVNCAMPCSVSVDGLPSPIPTETGFGGVAGFCGATVIGGMTAALTVTVQVNIPTAVPALSLNVTEKG